MQNGAGPPTSLFAPENRQQLEASFKQFLARPENRPLLEEHQAQEVRAAIQLQEAMHEAELHAQVMALTPQQQARLAPYLQMPVLRRVIQALAGGGAGAGAPSAPHGRGPRARAGAGAAAQAPPSQLAEWVDNPRVLEMLAAARRLLKRGHLSEQQLEELLLAGVHADASGAAERQVPGALPNCAVLPSHLLVEALNEHLAERRAGNKAYAERRYSAALAAYTRALAIVDFVQATNPDDQAEVDSNRVATLLNLAAAHMGLHEWGAAVARCDAALALRPGDAKALLRRAKANVGRHEYQAAQEDVRALQQVDPWCGEVGALQAAIAAGQRTAEQEKRLCAKMLGLRL